MPGSPFNPHRILQDVGVPNAVLAYRGLAPGAKLCYGYLISTAGANGRCWPSIRKITERLAVSEAQVHRYLASLVMHQFLQVEARRGHSNVYRFLWHATFNRAPARRRGVHMTTPGE